MMEHPDSALTILNDITDTFPNSEYDRNVYRILLTEARYKNWIDEENDSLISIATNYFNSRLSDPYRAKASLYHGLILNSKKRYDEALYILINAYHTNSIKKDTLISPFITRTIGDVLSNMNNPESAFDYYKKSYEEFRSVKSESYLADATYDLCRIAFKMDKPDTALTYGEKLYQLSQKCEDSTYFLSSLYVQGRAHYDLNQPKKTIHLLEPHIMSIPQYNKINAVEYLGKAYIEVGDMEKAKKMKKMLNELDSSRKALSWMIAEKEGDYRKAFLDFKSFSKNNFTIFSDWTKYRGEGLLLKNLELERENNRLDSERNQFYILALVLALIILIAVCVIIFLYLRNLKLKQHETMQLIITLQKDLAGKESMMAEIQRNHKDTISEKEAVIAHIQEDLAGKKSMMVEIQRNHEDTLSEKEAVIAHIREDLEGKESMIAEIQRNHEDTLSEKEAVIAHIREDLEGKESMIAEIQRNHEDTLSEKEAVIEHIREGLKGSMKAEFSLIDKIAKEYYEIEDLDKVQHKKIVKMMNKIIRDLKDSTYVTTNLCQLVNTRLDGLLDRLKSDYPDIKDDEITLFTFSLLRFSGKSIGLFMGITDNNVYARKRLLKLKLEKKGAETAAPYLIWL